MAAVTGAGRSGENGKMGGTHAAAGMGLDTDIEAPPQLARPDEEEIKKKIQDITEDTKRWDFSFQKWYERHEQVISRILTLAGTIVSMTVAIAAAQLDQKNCLDCTFAIVQSAIGFIVLFLIYFTGLRKIELKLQETWTKRKELEHSWKDLKTLGVTDPDIEDWCRDEEEPTTYLYRYMCVLGAATLATAMLLFRGCWSNCKA